MPLRIWSARRWIETTAWISASTPPAIARQDHAPHPGAQLVGPEDPEERAHQEHALEADVHHAAALGEHAADGGEDERGRVAQRGGDELPTRRRPTRGCARWTGSAKAPRMPNMTARDMAMNPSRRCAAPGRPRAEPQRHDAPSRRARPGCASRPAGRRPRRPAAPGRPPTAPYAVRAARHVRHAHAWIRSATGRAGAGATSTSLAAQPARAPLGPPCRCANRRHPRHAASRCRAPEPQDQDVGPDEQQHERPGSSA